MRRVAAVGLVLLLPLLLAGPARAAVEVTASVQPDAVAVGEAVTYTISVSGDVSGVSEPELPDLDGFRNAGSGTSTYFTFVNGRASKRTEYSHTLVPERAGTLTIGPATVREGGKAFRTDPLQVRVLPAGSRSRPQATPPSAAAPAFPQIPGFPRMPGFPPFPGAAPALRAGDVKIDLSANPTDPYVGQQVVLTFRMERAVDFAQQPDYTPAPTPGFRSYDADLPDNQAHSVRIENGRRRVTEVRDQVIFPLQAGDATVGPAELTFTVDPFSGGQHLVTDPVPIHVRPLPAAGRPADFAGAVGSFSLDARVDTDHAAAGGAVTLTVRLQGSGNFQDVSKLGLAAPDAVEVYDPEIHDDVAYGADGAKGTRTFKYVLVPKRAGDFRIGPVRLAAFDPATGNYRTVQSDPVTLTVTPAPSAPAAVPAPAPAASAPAAEPSVSRRDTLAWAGAVFAAGVMLLALRLWARRRQGPYAAPEVPPPPTPEALREALETALAEPEDGAFVREADRAFRAYLGVRWDLPAPRVEAAEIRRRMAGAPEAEREACLDALEALQAARFAPGGAGLDRDGITRRVRRAVEAVENGALAPA